MVTFATEPTGRTGTVRARLTAEFDALPGLRLTRAQIRRLLGFSGAECAWLLDRLIADGTLEQDASGRYVRSASHN